MPSNADSVILSLFARQESSEKKNNRDGVLKWMLRT